ncbi:hypothetical protein C3L33_10536, partial [Rhododendron williamsianum]
MKDEGGKPELYKSRVLELNASDDRGINVVRTKIKNFAAVAVGSGRQGGYPCPPFKIIILDEADSMTEDAQAKLYILLCPVLYRIIEPLASRCAKFRFKPLSEDIMTGRVLHICKEEGLDLDSEALSTLSSISQGDLRRAITYLQQAQEYRPNGLHQGAARLFGSSISSKDLISVSGSLAGKWQRTIQPPPAPLFSLTPQIDAPPSAMLNRERKTELGFDIFRSPACPSGLSLVPPGLGMKVAHLRVKA